MGAGEAPGNLTRIVHTARETPTGSSADVFLADTTGTSKAGTLSFVGGRQSGTTAKLPTTQRSLDLPPRNAYPKPTITTTMYRVIGADGREYGPVTAEVLKQWIAQGRANAATRVCLEGATDWMQLGSLPEFGFSGARQPDAPGWPPPGRPAEPPAPGQFHGTETAEAMARDAISNDYRFDISRCYSRAWDLMMKHFWLTVGSAALVLLILTAASAVPFASLLLTSVFLGGLDWLYLRLLRGERAELSDAFAGFSGLFVPLMLFSLVSQILIGVGFLFCILPGIYLTVAWVPFGALLIMDKKVDFWPAMELARKVVSHHWWQMLGFILLAFLINILGVMALCIGVFFTIPLTTIATVVAYEEVFSRVNPPAPIPSPLPPPPATPS